MHHYLAFYCLYQPAEIIPCLDSWYHLALVPTMYDYIISAHTHTHTYIYIYYIYITYLHTHLHTQIMITIKQYINVYKTIYRYPQSPLVRTGPCPSPAVACCIRAATSKILKLAITCPVLRCPAGKVAQCLTSANAKLRGSAADLKSNRRWKHDERLVRPNFKETSVTLSMPIRFTLLCECYCYHCYADTFSSPSLCRSWTHRWPAILSNFRILRAARSRKGTDLP
jgi:hypothetical protein